MPLRNFATSFVVTLVFATLAWPASAGIDLQVQMPDGSTMYVQLDPNQDLQVQDTLSGTVYRLRLDSAAADGERLAVLLLDGEEQLVQRVELTPGERVTAGRDGQFVELLRPEASEAVRAERPDAGPGLVRLEVAWNADGPPAVALAMPGEPVQLSRPGVTLRATVNEGITQVQLERDGRTARYSLPLGAQLTVPAVGDTAAMGIRTAPHTPNPDQAYALPVSDNLMGLCVKLHDGENITGVVREGELFRIRTSDTGPTLGFTVHHDAEADEFAVQAFEIHTLAQGREGLEHVQALHPSADAAALLERDGVRADVRAFRIDPEATGNPDKAGTSGSVAAAV